MHKEILEDIGEKELINRLGKFMPKNQISDDCALIKTKNKDLLVNTDSLVENVHFNDTTIFPVDLGWKAVVSNISDLLSSGSKKTIGITINLVLPARTEWIWVEELYRGINKALKEYGGIILGGDCSKGNQKVISITAFGIQGELELRRNACKPGDVILTTGIHGLSKLGFLIQNKICLDNDISLNKRLISKSIEHFCCPKVYPNFLKNLIKTRSNKKIKRIGCTDSSDGLFQALQDLACASKCKAIINYEKIPKDKDWPIGDKWDEYYFFGGEDYELVFSLPKKWAKNLSEFDKDINEIGFFADGEPSIEFKDSNKNKLLNNTPFRHF
ncbi:thiamine-phosphate kinase [Prochlorococcus marinus XMU1414]|uniref:Thiamine-monophosphate kinase n=1 Tax=Prochlorococcus marinus XMU1424 TaxID=2774497 RepID=A0A9D9BW81_PROMR|nr:thiamine-phosphate kinase [Prochlorococcus marinus]MBO8227303.1 thiamine-phosphate kinase [Prochlorococcus marinus XMU1414]MBW3046647.1 thiamine-phosphate kinase [Prochlorococcus marinus str. MU1414]MCR8532916.1 thiamine-phosphate kinase [Prochlorococcus marinus XMU1420]MCR8536185.1 thiamine-phosphate kinase [Prochlorococcus marinus XMU1424]